MPGFEGRVVVLEPRRIAALTAARRVAEEQGFELGQEVGYQVRFERVHGRRTRVLFVTEGILVRRLQEDPLLEGVGCVVFDEHHERSLHTDLSLAIVRRVQREVRPDLLVVAMSATLDVERVASYLGDAPVVRSEGRLHLVEVRLLERADFRLLPAQVAAAVRRARRETTGAVLSFLPGKGEIEATARILSEEFRDEGPRCCPSTASCRSPDRQRRCVARASRKRRGGSFSPPTSPRRCCRSVPGARDPRISTGSMPRAPRRSRWRRSCCFGSAP
jgi:ATP-dependent helicase HrpB